MSQVDFVPPPPLSQKDKDFLQYAKPARRLRIKVDMDAICVDLTPYWLECIAKDTGVVETIDNITQWNLHKCGKLVALGAKVVYDYLQKPGFFLNAPEIPTSLAIIKSWQDSDHDVMIATSPSGPISIIEKYGWWEAKAPWMKSTNIAMINRKEELHGDVLVDDHPETGNKFLIENPDALVLGIEYEYNKHVTGGPVMIPGYKDYTSAWKQIDAMVRQLALGVSQ
jgi:5'(3')-deoxyribonucleotidase